MMQDTRPDQRERFWGWLALFAGFGFFATGRWAVPIAAWLVAIFGIRFFRNYPRAVRGYFLMAAASFVSGFAWWGATPIEDNPAGELVFLATAALTAPLVFLVDRWVVSRFRRGRRAPFWTTLAFPLVATAGAFVFLGLSPVGTFGADAYTQYGWEPVMQLVSVTGLWGLTFLMAWFASVANYAWESDFVWRKYARGAVAYGIVLILVLGFGFGRLWLSPDAEAEVHVVGITSAADLVRLVDSRDEPTFDAAVAEVHREYLSRTANAAARGAEIVVWPEVAGLGYADQVASLIDNAAELAAAHGIYLVMPTLVMAEGDEVWGDNEVRIFTPEGQIGLTHVKYGGDTAKIYGGDGAKELQTLDTPFGTLSAIICWDADYPNVVSQAGRKEIDLLIVSARDWAPIKDIHAQMAVFRAVENGVPLVRQTSNGVSLAADAYGRELSYVDNFRGVFEQDVIVPLNATTTIYPQIRDTFGWLSVLAFVTLAIGTLAKGRYSKRRQREPALHEPGERVTTKAGL